jgi:hypothetical protein
MQVDAATAQYQSWMLDKYKRFVSHLLSLLRHSDARLQVSALHLLMDFVALECAFKFIIILFLESSCLGLRGM